jgi:CO/xanthine dehydrogenase Mo-binding subunit
MSPDGTAARNAFGQPMRRKEDVRLLLGQGRFTADLLRPGMAHAAMIRSPHAHAVVTGIDAAAARAMPGVLAVLTGADSARSIRRWRRGGCAMWARRWPWWWPKPRRRRAMPPRPCWWNTTRCRR